MLIEQAEDIGTEGRDINFGFGLANASPPKHYDINKGISLNGKYKFYSIPNISTASFNEKNVFASYVATKAKGWNEEKKRFDWYYIDGEGWLHSNNSMDGLEKDRIKMVFDSNWIDFYNEPSLESTKSTLNINPYKIKTHVSEAIEGWNPEKGRYDWYKINIPEYNIKEKWIYDPYGTVSTDIYRNGILDQIWYRQLNVENVENPGELLNNTFNWQGAIFKPNSLYELSLENNADVNKFYIKSSTLESYSSGLSLTLYNSKGDKFVEEISKSELENGLIELKKEIKDVNRVQIRNNGTNIRIDEFEMFGIFDKTAESPISKEKYNGNENFIFDLSKSWNALYDEPYELSPKITLSPQEGLKGKILSQSKWNPDTGVYEWLKIDVKGYGEKWIKSSGFKYPNQYYDGILDKIMFKVVEQTGVSDIEELYNNNPNNWNDTKIETDGSLAIQLDTDQENNINKMFVKISNNFVDIKNDTILFSFIDNDGKIAEKSVTKEELVKGLIELSELKLKNVKFIEIKNVSGGQLKIKEMEFFGKAQSPLKNFNQVLTINGWNELFDKQTEFGSVAIIKNLGNENQAFSSSKGVLWDINYGNYKWIKISNPIEGQFEWIKGGNKEPIYLKGWLNKKEYKVLSSSLSDTNRIIDDSISPWAYARFNPDDQTTFSFPSKGTLNEVYIKSQENFYKKNFKLQLIINGKVEKVLNNDDFFKERILLDSPVSNVEEITLKNIGDETINLIEVDFL